MRGCAETEEANAIAGFDPGHAKAAKADDTGTEKRSGVQVVQVRRERIDEVGTCHCVLRITAVDGVSSKDRRIAEVLEAAPAIRTISVDTADPRNTYAGSGRQGGRCTLYDFAYDLMAGDEWLHSRWQFSLDDVKIGAAHAAGSDLQKHLTRRGHWLWSLFYVKRLFRCSEDRGFQDFDLREMRSPIASIADRIPR